MHTTASHLGLILLISSILILPTALIGIPDNYDLQQHLRFARTYSESMTMGEFTPKWGEADNRGFGSAGVRFYPPLTYWVLGAAFVFTNSWYDSLWITILLWMIVASCGAYFLGKEWLPPGYALFAAALYAVIPYHLVQVFQAFLLAEFTASAILPFCFLFALRTVRDGLWRNALLFSAAFGGLILSHIPSAIIGTLSLGIFILLILERPTLARSIGRFTSAAALSLFASSFYWLRLITELQWIKHNTTQFYSEGAYNYAKFLFPMFLGDKDAYSSQLLWVWDLVIVQTFLISLPVILMIVLRKRGRETIDRHILALVFTGLFAFLMMSVASKPLWDNISILQKIQFPWRWLSVASFIVSLTFPIALHYFINRRPVLTRMVAYPMALLLLSVAILDLTQIIIPSGPVSRQHLEKRMESLDDEPGCECWWPVWAKNEALEHQEKILSIDRAFEIISWQRTSRAFKVDAGQPIDVRVSTFYYPYWKAIVNGKEVVIGKDTDGTMLIPLPAEDANVDLHFREPAFISVAKVISLLTWLGLITALAVFVRSRKPLNDQ